MQRQCHSRSVEPILARISSQGSAFALIHPFPSRPCTLSLHRGNTGTAVQRCSSSNPLCDTSTDCCWGRYTKPSFPSAHTLLLFHRSIYLHPETPYFSVSTDQIIPCFLAPMRACNSFLCVCVCAHTHTHYACMHECARVYAQVHACMHVRARMCVHVCLCVCTEHACFCRYMGSVLGCRIFSRQWAARLR